MRRKTYILWKRILTRLAILICIGGFLFVYLRTGVFTLDTYIIIGAPDAYVEGLTRDSKLIAEEKLFKILPGNRSISYHYDEIRTLITETLPNTSKVSILPTGLHTLTIRITQYVPLFSVSDTHVISTDGTVYKEIIPIDDFPRLSIATTTEVRPSTLVALNKLVSNINSVLFKVKYISIDTYDDIRLYDDAQKRSIIVSSGSDMTKIWSNLVSAIDTNPLKDKLQSGMYTLEYIDTRFGNKVFYKFTNGNSPAIIPPHATSSTTISQ